MGEPPVLRWVRNRGYDAEGGVWTLLRREGQPGFIVIYTKDRKSRVLKGADRRPAFFASEGLARATVNRAVATNVFELLREGEFDWLGWATE